MTSGNTRSIDDQLCTYCAELTQDSINIGVLKCCLSKECTLESVAWPDWRSQFCFV